MTAPRKNPGLSTSDREQIVGLLDDLADGVGLQTTYLDGVQLIREVEPFPRQPLVYKPGIIIVGQGSKRVYIGERVITYDPHNYLVLSVPLPIECEFLCSENDPLLGLYIDVDPAMIGEMMLEMDESIPTNSKAPEAILSTPMDEKMGGSVIRLLENLHSRRDAKILGQMVVREIMYHVMMGEQGDALRVLAAQNESFTKIARVLRQIHSDPSQPVSAEILAKQAQMSVSTFHHAFKEITASSPIQYIKRMRLDSARRLMVHEGHTASSAAATVGYESASHFSREFKRLFGAAPAEDAKRQRARLGT